MAGRGNFNPDQGTLFQADEFNSSARPKPGRWIQMSSSRVQQARYDSGLQQIQVVFRDGTPWVYDSVPTNIWRNFRRTSSPGRYINRVLNGYAYWEGSFDSSQEGDDE